MCMFMLVYMYVSRWSSKFAHVTLTCQLRKQDVARRRGVDVGEKEEEVCGQQICMCVYCTCECVWTYLCVLCR